MDHRKGLIFALITASFWGFMAIVLKVITDDLSPLTVVWFRFSLAFLLLALWSLFFRRADFRIFTRPPLLLFLAALFLALNYTGFIAGIKYVSPSTAQIFIQTGPVSFAFAGIVLFREHVNWRHLAGFVFVVGGMVLFYSEQLRELGSGAENLGLGILLVLGGGISWAGFATSQKALLKSLPPGQINLFVFGACSLALLPFARLSSLGDTNPVHWIILVYLGLNTVLAYGSLALAIKYTEAARVSVIITLNPLITFLTMAILGGLEVRWIAPEAFTLPGMLGAVSVIGGAIVVILAGWSKGMNGRHISSHNTPDRRTHMKQ
jgi:drug/metabolite transporter (DMT)-like permease